MYHLLAALTDGVVVRFGLVLVVRFAVGEMEFFDDLFFGKKLKVAVDSGEVNLREECMERCRRKWFGVFLERVEDGTTLFSEPKIHSFVYANNLHFNIYLLYSQLQMVCI